MSRRIAVLTALAALGAGCLWADFSYEQTSRMTGGMMAGVMKIAGAFSKQAREPMRYTVLVKGNRMATLHTGSGQVIDLDKETITDIDFERRTYSVITFAQMAEALKQLEAKMKSEKGEEQADISVKASVKETGQSKPISGVNAREVVLTLEMEGTDQKSGQRGVFMVVTADMWLGQHAGYSEVRDFYHRMAQKLNWTPGSGMIAQGQSGIMRGMADLQREAAKLEGVPVYQVTKFNMQGAAVPEGQQPPPEPQRAPQPQAQPQETPSVGGALGRLGGRLGGLGGLARRRKSEPEAAPPPQAAPQTAQTPQAGGAAPVMMEITSELTSFSTSAIDPAKFEVPAGFKQVESQTLRGMRR
jgi:hypothetical protein